ncbi:MAG: hypothetical protein B0D92_00780 [Spirochaeta sp. LUC14_002_19_P3]|nr:MAG: hypothetical protein B0D92_00780 [Spirochaeta sp. LUC14_002_19_P3]
MQKKKQFSRLQILRLGAQLSYALLLILSVYSENFIALIVFLAAALIGGAFYCGWLCPMGAAQEWLGNLGKKIFRGKRLRVPVKLERVLIGLRYLLMIAGLTGLALFYFIYFLSEPYISFTLILKGHTAYLTVSAAVYLGFMLLLALLVDRPFCRYFCTQGAQFGLLSLVRLFSIRRRSESCISCKLCDAACPTQVELHNRSHIRHPQCINCLKCITACPVPNTLSYGWAVSLPIKIKNKKENNNE